MTTFVVHLVPVGGKCPATVTANIGLLSSVGSDMVTQGSALRKPLGAVGIRAGVSLDSQVFVSMSC